MNSTSKTLTITLIVLLLISLLAIVLTSADVQAVTKPSVPHFNVKFIDNSYDIPSSATTITDPFTGEKNTITTPGRYMKNHTIEVTIKNQFFTPSTAENGMERQLRYVVQFKGHYADDWQVWGEVYQSDSQYTVLSNSVNYATGSKVDFRVEAEIGHLEFIDNVWFIPYFVSDASSGWSNIQTFTMPGAATTTPPQNPTTTPDNNNNQPQQPDQNMPPSFVFHPSFLLWLGTILFVGAIVIVVLAFLRRHLKPPNYNNPSHNI